MKVIGFIAALTSLIFTACSEKTSPIPSKPQPEVEGEYHYLKDTHLKIWLPKGFRESGVNRLRNDFKFLKQDTTLIHFFERAMNRMEFLDADMDVFSDTSSNFRMLIILDAERIPLDQTSGSLLAKKIKEQHEEEELESGWNITYTKLETTFKKAIKGEFFKFKYKITSTSGQQLFDIRYALSTDSRTFLIFEFSETEDDLENSIAKIQ
jgi:hypothetical protein